VDGREAGGGDRYLRRPRPAQDRLQQRILDLEFSVIADDVKLAERLRRNRPQRGGGRNWGRRFIRSPLGDGFPVVLANRSLIQSFLADLTLFPIRD